VDLVKVALLEWDEALRKVCEDLAAMRTVVAEWETELASTRDQLQQDYATLEGARSWQSQAEQLRADLSDKVASLATMGEQLQQERGTRQ
jgi:DNA repair ATPase RecN